MIRHLSARPIATEPTGVKAETSDPQLAAALRPLVRICRQRSPSRRRAVLRLGVAIRLTPGEWRVAAESRFARAHEMVARIWRDWGFPGLGCAGVARPFRSSVGLGRQHPGTVLDALGQPVEAERARTGRDA